jgi:hypothetical protein
MSTNQKVCTQAAQNLLKPYRLNMVEYEQEVEALATALLQVAEMQLETLEHRHV